MISGPIPYTHLSFGKSQNALKPHQVAYEKFYLLLEDKK